MPGPPGQPARETSAATQAATRLPVPSVLIEFLLTEIPVDWAPEYHRPGRVERDAGSILMMRIALILTVISLTFSGAIAEARPRSADDDALVAALFKDVDTVSAILEKDVDHPKAALKKLDKLMKKRRKPMKKTVAKLATVFFIGLRRFFISLS